MRMGAGLIPTTKMLRSGEHAAFQAVQMPYGIKASYAPRGTPPSPDGGLRTWSDLTFAMAAPASDLMPQQPWGSPKVLSPQTPSPHTVHPMDPEDELDWEEGSNDEDEDADRSGGPTPGNSPPWVQAPGLQSPEASLPEDDLSTDTTLEPNLDATDVSDPPSSPRDAQPPEETDLEASVDSAGTVADVPLHPRDPLPMQPLVVPPCGRKPSAFYDRLAAAAPWDGDFEGRYDPSEFLPVRSSPNHNLHPNPHPHHNHHHVPYQPPPPFPVARGPPPWEGGSGPPPRPPLPRPVGGEGGPRDAADWRRNYRHLDPMARMVEGHRPDPPRSVPVPHFFGEDVTPSSKQKVVYGECQSCSHIEEVPQGWMSDDQWLGGVLRWCSGCGERRSFGSVCTTWMAARPPHTPSFAQPPFPSYNVPGDRPRRPPPDARAGGRLEAPPPLRWDGEGSSRDVRPSWDRGGRPPTAPWPRTPGYSPIHHGPARYPPQGPSRSDFEREFGARHPFPDLFDGGLRSPSPQRTPRRPPGASVTDECDICMERGKDHCLDPCGHRFCGPCVQALRTKTCPVCTRPFAKSIRLF